MSIKRKLFCCELTLRRNSTIEDCSYLQISLSYSGQYRPSSPPENDTSTYGPSTSTLIRLYKSNIRSLFDYGAPATCVASPHLQRIWEGVQTHFITRALSIPFFIHNDRKRQHAYLPPIHDRNLYIAKRWYRRAMLHNSGVQDYVDNHTHNKRKHTGSRNTPLELIRN